MYDDPKRYENDNLYDKDTDYEDEYDTDVPDYIDEDEEDENALWDDEKDTTDETDPDESPRNKRRKRRKRKERYHELFRSGDDVPLDYGAAEGGLYFPDTLNDVLSKLELKGDFIDSIFYYPYDIHELVKDGDISDILRELSEDGKFLMFLWALRQYSSVRIAAIRGQSDRNIRKVRNTMLGKI